MPSHDMPVEGPAPTLQAGTFDAMAATVRDHKRLLKRMEMDYLQVKQELAVMESSLNAFIGRATCV